MSPPPRRTANPLFPLAAVSTAAFIVTIFALVAVMFGDQSAPPVRFLNRHGGTLIAWEAGVTLLLGVLAMAVDRVQSLRRARREGTSADGSRDDEIV
jgi:hypothetical protein